MVVCFLIVDVLLSCKNRVSVDVSDPARAPVCDLLDLLIQREIRHCGAYLKISEYLDRV